MNPDLLAETLARKAKQGKLPKAVILVHLYGQSADIIPILETCNRYGVPLIEDAAEALGATYKGRSPGVFGRAGIFSFNGNKIITTSGGGMLVSDDAELIAHPVSWPPRPGTRLPYYYVWAQIGRQFVVRALARGLPTTALKRVLRTVWVFTPGCSRLFYRLSVGRAQGNCILLIFDGKHAASLSLILQFGCT